LNKWEHCGRHFWIEAGKNCPLLFLTHTIDLCFYLKPLPTGNLWANNEGLNRKVVLEETGVSIVTSPPLISGSSACSRNRFPR